MKEPWLNIAPSASAMSRLSHKEAYQLVGKIRPIFTPYADRYDTAKYLPHVYKKARIAFAAPKSVSSQVLKDAILWKYGHLNKDRIPYAHTKLIIMLQRRWPELAQSLPSTPEAIFKFLEDVLTGAKKGSRYITIAFLTHLVFSTKIPIIDQHNFRAVNHLLKTVRPLWRDSRKPFLYEDLELVKHFADAVRAAWRQRYPNERPSPRKFDKFLMMYGKYLKSRRSTDFYKARRGLD